MSSVAHHHTHTVSLHPEEEGGDGEERGRGREGGRKEYPQSLLHAAHDKRQIWEEAEEKVNTFYLSIRLSILDEV